MKKGQTIEILGFLALVVIAVTAILALGLVTSEQKTDVRHIIQESHEEEYFKAGANTLNTITEPKTGKTFIELMGLVGFFEKNILEFGETNEPITVDVSKELTTNLNLIYGEGHWHLNIYHEPAYQIYVIMLLDVSISMKEEIDYIKNDIQHIINEIETTTNRRVAYKLYFLPGGEFYRNEFNLIVQKNPNFKTYLVEDLNCAGLPPLTKNEAWAKGMKCLIDKESDEWGTVTAKVGIILSDEPPSGCEGCGCKHYQDEPKEACCPNVEVCKQEIDTVCDIKTADINSLIDTANAIDMNIFTLKATPCKLPDKFNSQCHFNPKTPYTCSGEDKLIEFMTQLSDGTGAEMFTVDNPENVPKAIREIVLSQPIPDIPFELGSNVPVNKRIRTYVIPSPTPIPGTYVKTILKQWN